MVIGNHNIKTIKIKVFGYHKEEKMVIVVKAKVEENLITKINNVPIIVNWVIRWMNVTLNMDILHSINQRLKKFLPIKKVLVISM